MKLFCLLLSLLSPLALAQEEPPDPRTPGKACTKDRDCGWHTGFICGEKQKCVKGCRSDGDCPRRQICQPVRACQENAANCPKVCFREADIAPKKPVPSSSACLSPTPSNTTLAFNGHPFGALFVPAVVPQLLASAEVPPVLTEELELAERALSSNDWTAMGIACVLVLTWLARRVGHRFHPWFDSEMAGVVLSILAAALVTILRAVVDEATRLTPGLVLVAFFTAATASGVWSWGRKVQAVRKRRKAAKRARAAPAQS